MSHSGTETKNAYFQLHLSTVLISATGLFARTIDLPAMVLTGYRSIAACACLALIIKFRKGALAPREYDWRQKSGLIILGILFTIHWWTYFEAIQFAGVAVGMAAFFTFPVMSALMEPLLVKRGPKIKLTLADFFVAVVVCAGVYVLVSQKKSVPTDADRQSLGVIYGLISAFVYALRNILLRDRFAGLPASTAMFWMLCVAAVLLAPALFFERLPNPVEIGLIIVLGLVFSAVAHTLFAASLAVISARRAGVITSLQPIYGTALAWILLSEAPTVVSIIGGAIILSGVAFETWYHRNS